MSEFSSRLIVRPLDKEELVKLKWSLGWELQNSFSYDLGKRGGGDKIRLPAGLRSNGASVPRWLWWLIHPCDPDIGKAAWIHDYLYGLQQYSKIYCDAVLCDGMITLKSSAWKARLCFDAVHYFGYSAWKYCQVVTRKANPECQLPYPVMV